MAKTPPVTRAMRAGRTGSAVADRMGGDGAHEGGGLPDYADMLRDAAVGEVKRLANTKSGNYDVFNIMLGALPYTAPIQPLVDGLSTSAATEEQYDALLEKDPHIAFYLVKKINRLRSQLARENPEGVAQPPLRAEDITGAHIREYVEMLHRHEAESGNFFDGSVKGVGMAAGSIVGAGIGSVAGGLGAVGGGMAGGPVGAAIVDGFSGKSSVNTAALTDMLRDYERRGVKVGQDADVMQLSQIMLMNDEARKEAEIIFQHGGYGGTLEEALKERLDALLACVKKGKPQKDLPSDPAFECLHGDEIDSLVRGHRNVNTGVGKGSLGQLLSKPVYQVSAYDVTLLDVQEVLQRRLQFKGASVRLDAGGHAPAGHGLPEGANARGAEDPELAPR